VPGVTSSTGRSREEHTPPGHVVAFRGVTSGEMVVCMLHLNVAEGVHRIENAYTNWYAIEDGKELTIVDTGHPRSWASLEALMRTRERRPTAVVLTHAHFDHMGFAERARSELGIAVYAHEREVPVTRHPLQYDHERSRVPYMLRHPGFDRAFFAMTLMGALFVRGVESVETFTDGEQLDVPGNPRVVYTPGHTHGHCALHLADRGVVITGDAFVTYNPYTNSQGPQIVSGAATADSAEALASLDRLAALDADVALTGHGEPWRGCLGTALAKARDRGPT
jgi:glyoxylase-like metal-dependent hydrolase (beta-lactamase superfamily II)